MLDPSKRHSVRRGSGRKPTGVIPTPRLPLKREQLALLTGAPPLTLQFGGGTAPVRPADRGLFLRVSRASCPALCCAFVLLPLHAWANRQRSFRSRPEIPWPVSHRPH